MARKGVPVPRTNRYRATHQFVATWVWRAGHAQMTAIHFRAIKQHPIILK
jgi:hypothetical protein